MTDILYRAQMDDIVIEVTPTQVRSDLWDFPDPIAIKDIVDIRVQRSMHHASTLFLPVLAIFFGILGTYVVMRSDASEASLLVWPVLVLFIGFGLHRLYRFFVHRRSQLVITTIDDTEGVLYFTQDNSEFLRFKTALETAIGGVSRR